MKQNHMAAIIFIINFKKKNLLIWQVKSWGIKMDEKKEEKMGHQ